LRLLRHSADTFQAALLDVIKPYTVPQLFERFRAWLDRTTIAAVNGLPLSPNHAHAA
jgi:hypothetical protein